MIIMIIIIMIIIIILMVIIVTIVIMIIITMMRVTHRHTYTHTHTDTHLHTYTRVTSSMYANYKRSGALLFLSLSQVIFPVYVSRRDETGRIKSNQMIERGGE